MAVTAGQRRILPPPGARSTPPLRSEGGAAGSGDGCGPGNGPGPRFVAVLEPTENYSVFDEQCGVPVEIGHCVLIGLSHSRAILLCHLLNSGRVPSAALLRLLGLWDSGKP